MALLVHMGIRESEFDTMRNQIIRLLPDGIELVKTDLEWDSDYTETFLDKVLHVVISTLSPMIVLNMLISEFQNFFVPLSGSDKDGVKIYVTDVLRSRANEDVHEYDELRYPN